MKSILFPGLPRPHERACKEHEETPDLVFDSYVRIEFLGTGRANAVAEAGCRMISYMPFNLTPLPFVVTDLFAGHTDGQQAT
ncbi:MAG: hypothetical protein SWH78_09405 [Thermodesulfobacteriota bacterium]|nr:hypothetical protein [Thermodesulfobacteriota bacterium]